MISTTVAVDQHPPIITDFAYSPLEPALWRETGIDGLKFRDLGTTTASHGELTTRHLRVGDAPITTTQIGGADGMFAFVFILSGSGSLQRDGGADELKPLTAVTRAGAGGASWTLDPHTEIFEIVADRPLWEHKGEAGWRVSQDSGGDYLVGDGPRKFFAYRDLQVSELTDRRIHIHIVRVARPVETGTGWHSHSMGQIFYVLAGWADLEVDARPWVRMAAGDAMCLGPRMGHNVAAFSNDYVVLEMCIPADYSTDDREAPKP